jgi:hypothetical protein
LDYKDNEIIVVDDTPQTIAQEIEGLPVNISGKKMVSAAPGIKA